MWRLTLAVAFALATTTAKPAAAQEPARRDGNHDDRPSIIDKFLEPESTPLVSYRAVRRMTASTRGGRMQASMEALTQLDPVHGFTFQILSEDGSTLIRRKVLLAALEAEQKAFMSAEAAGAALTPANYEFLGVTVASERLVKIDVRPRRKHQMLIDGALFVASDSADLVRIEGDLAKRPSIWTRRVRIRREYERVSGVHVPVSMQSTADVLLVGTSSFAMTYRYLEINGRTISQP